MALQGTIDSFPVADVLQLLGTSAKTGRLDIEGDRGRGTLWVRDGDVVAGSVTQSTITSAPDVVFEFFLFDEGSFEFTSGDEPTERPFSMSVADALEQASSMVDCWHTIKEVLPSVDCGIELVSNLGSTEVTLDVEEWALVVACGGARDAGAIIAALGTGEFEGSRRISDLVSRGLAVVDASVARESETAGSETAESVIDEDRVSTSFAADSVAADSFTDDSFTDDSFTDDSFTDDDGTDGNGTDDDDRVSDGRVSDAPGQPPAFPEHFPIDDLVESDQQVSFDGSRSPFRPMAASEGAPMEADSWEPQPSTGENAIGAISDRADGAFSSDRRGEPDPSEVIGADAFAEADSQPPTGSDNVLAQIGRLSPKAAEAIAAALGDGDKR